MYLLWTECGIPDYACSLLAPCVPCQQIVCYHCNSLTLTFAHVDSD
uniref:Uncharacterized protein n=1 Tax=Arundo donax TaxID=35708 RepID=A0A0A9EDH5_ARUDO